MTTLTCTAVSLLADNASGNTGPDFGKASPFGLLVVVLLLIATFGLVWSMNRHLNKLPESFDGNALGTERDRADEAGADAPAPKNSAQEPDGQPTG